MRTLVLLGVVFLLPVQGALSADGKEDPPHFPNWSGGGGVVAVPGEDVAVSGEEEGAQAKKEESADTDKPEELEEEPEGDPSAPLDTWHAVDLPTASTTTTLEIPRYFEEGDEPTEEVAVTRIPIPSATRRSLTKAEKIRFEKLRGRLRGRSKAQLEAMKAERLRDRRGAAEARICLADLSGYGEKKEVKRMVKKLTAFRAVERTFPEAVSSAACDVIAVFGIVGRSYSYGVKGMASLKELLGKKLKGDWDFYLAEAVRERSFTGVLVRKGLMQFRGSKTISAAELPQTRRFTERKLPRSLLEVRLVLAGKEGKGGHEIRLFLFDLRKSLTIPDTESMRVQVAELARRRAIEEASADVSSERPMFFLFGGVRASKSRDPASYVLSGRLHFQDFLDQCDFAEVKPERGSKSGPAEKNQRKRKEKQTGVVDFRCSSRVSRPEILFNVLPERSSLAALVFDRDLPFVRQGAAEGLRFTTGSVPFENGQPESAVAWVEVNW